MGEEGRVVREVLDRDNRLVAEEMVLDESQKKINTTTTIKVIQTFLVIDHSERERERKDEIMGSLYNKWKFWPSFSDLELEFFLEYES